MADDQNPELPLTPPPGDSGPGAANIQPINIEDEMRRSYLDYSMSVIIGRALPDVRDGLKPVHRRILYAMQEMGLQHNRPHASAPDRRRQPWVSIIRTATLPSTTRWSAWRSRFRMRYPLIDGQGNFGSVDGDPPAADRYTEAPPRAHCGRAARRHRQRHGRFPSELRRQSKSSLTFCPTRVPNLLINGSDGIAVGMATKIPPHNLTEIVDAAITLVNNPATPLPEILKIVKGPDFPTGGIHSRQAGILDAYKHRPRPLHHARQSRDRNHQQRPPGDHRHRNSVPGEQAHAHRAHRGTGRTTRRIDDISDIRDESDRDGMRIVVELKRGAEPQIVLNQLFKHTQMQESFSMILLAVVQRPAEGNGPDPGHPALHRSPRRRCAPPHGIPAAQSQRPRAHFRRLHDRARSSGQRDRHHSRQRRIAAKLAKTWSHTLAARRLTSTPPAERPKLDPEKPFTAIQADAILELQLHRLTRLSIDEIPKELERHRENIAEYESILGSEKKLRGVIVKELEEVKKQYGDERRT